MYNFNRFNGGEKYQNKILEKCFNLFNWAYNFLLTFIEKKKNTNKMRQYLVSA